MNNEKRIYEMTQSELNDQYRNVILKQREADQAYKLMGSGGDKKTKKSNWLNFEKAFPPMEMEVKKIEFLRLINEDEAKMAPETKYERVANAFSSASPAYSPRGHLPITPAKTAYERYKTHYNTYSDLSDATLIAECEKVVLNSPDGPEYCFHIAHLTNEAWPEAERRIAESPWWSYMYAKMVLKGPFLDGEATIATSGQYAYRYAWFVINGRFVQGEQAISQDPRASFFYAQRVIGGRFVLGEAAIFQAETDSDASASAVSLAAEYRKWCIKIGTPIVYSSNTVNVGVLS